ncbi:transglutaminase domain-containing protein [Clostridium saccharoperbutylacetonicum]|uniref:transglutaminase domain-containing protein n=1 Tax=Clostridium saccharoperbutylacetonicum TaxID=36745 RepID=UPI0039ED46C1
MRKVIKILITIFIITSNTVSIAHADTYKNLNEIQQSIYQHLQNRDETINFEFIGDKDEFKKSISQIITSAYSEDDYTERSWVKIDPSAQSENNEIYTTIKVEYLTTKEQESYVDEQIKNILSQIIKPSMTDLEKVKVINDYLINKYDYDYSLKSNNAYSALLTGKAICQGYALTAYKMLTAEGIKNRIIVGSVNSISHSWNYVCINNKWYHLDITDDDSTRSNKYYLCDDSTLEKDRYVWNKAAYPAN